MDSILYYPCSFTGRRKNNEDAYYTPQVLSTLKLFAVADGMGGANAGEVASKLAIETISSFLEEELKPKISFSDENVKEIIKKGFEVIQLAIASAVKTNPSYSGMGTTLVLLMNYNSKWFVANLGDSRLYRIRKQRVELLTKDHSLLQEYLDSHDEPPDEAWLKNYSSYIVKALDGTNSTPDVFIIDEDINESNDDSCFLLCSDGLLPEKGMGEELPYAAIIQSSRHVREAAEQLVAAAFQKGSKDNITVVLVVPSGFKYSPSDSKKLSYPPGAETLPSKPVYIKRKSFLPVSLLVTCLIICLIGIFYYTLRGTSGNVGYKTDSSSIPAVQNNTNTELNTQTGDSWKAFQEDLYILPKNKDSKLTWNPYPGYRSNSTYRIMILNNSNMIIDSAMVKQSSVPLSEFKNIEAGHDYLIEIKVILGNNVVIPSTNTVTLKFK